MHTYSAPTTPPSRSSEIWWSGRWDRQHDGVVSMVESFCLQGFACLRGGRRTEKGGFIYRAAASRELVLTKPAAPYSFYSRPILHRGLGQKDLRVTHANRIAPPDQIDPSINRERACPCPPCAWSPGPLDGLAIWPTRRPGVPAHQRPEAPAHPSERARSSAWALHLIERARLLPGRRPLLPFFFFFPSFISSK
jgi:hypothetical protein